jgi:hypothetical protein
MVYATQPAGGVLFHPLPARMKIIAAVTRPASVRRILDHLGLPSEVPELHPGRPPPQLEMERASAEAEDFHADPPGPDW